MECRDKVAVLADIVHGVAVDSGVCGRDIGKRLAVIFRKTVVSKPTIFLRKRMGKEQGLQGTGSENENENESISVPGSPNVTAAAIFSAAWAGSSLAALWTSCPPWLYPAKTIFVSGQLESAC